MSETTTMNPRYLAIGALIYAFVSALWIVIAVFLGGVNWAGVIGLGTELFLWLADWGRLWTARQAISAQQQP